MKQLTVIAMFTMVGAIAASSIAHADVVGRYDCHALGSTAPEPIGDRAGHGLQQYQFSCVGVDGPLKGAIYTAINATEWDGPNGKQLLGGGVHRMPDGLAVTQMQEGAHTTVEMKDGKLAGISGAGKAAVKFASGSLVSLSGKTLNFVSKSIGFNHFVIEFSE